QRYERTQVETALEMGALGGDHSRGRQGRPPVPVRKVEWPPMLAVVRCGAPLKQPSDNGKPAQNVWEKREALARVLRMTVKGDRGTGAGRGRETRSAREQVQLTMWVAHVVDEEAVLL